MPNNYLQFKAYMVKILRLSILAVFVAGHLLNLEAGWADNGDFSRIAVWFSSGPLNYEMWPTPGTPAFDERFFKYYLPEWKLDFPLDSPMFISAVLLWLPGVLINRIFYSAHTLLLPILSLVPRLALLGFLLLVFYWIDRRARRPWLAYLALALPLALLFSTTDVAAFYNSFYQETGSLVFIPWLLAVLVWARHAPRKWPFYLLYLLSVTLVTTSKSACFYWAVLPLPFIISWAQVRSKPWVYLPLGLALIALPLLLSLKLTHVPTDGPVRPYNALFTGVLMLSDNPQARLAELGMPEAVDCVGQIYYWSGGADCLQRVAAQTTYFAVLQTMLREPQIMLKQIDLVGRTLQNYSLDLGKYRLGDQTRRQARRLNLWSELKQRYFPRGWALLALLVVAGGLLVAGYRQPGLAGDLARVGLICLAAFFLDCFVELVGDGQRDLLKHLFVPNLLFDFMLIAVTNIAFSLVGRVSLYGKKR